MKWHTDLLAQFEHQNVSDAKADMLLTIFKDRLPEVMQTAVIEYLKTGGDWFPTVRQLQTYVDAAQTEHDRGITSRYSAKDIAAWTQERRDKWDKKMYEWEIARNPNSVLED